MAISLVAAGTFVTGSSVASLTPTFQSATTAGNLGVVCVTTPGTSIAISLPSGWQQAIGIGGGGAIWYKPNCVAGESNPVVSFSPNATVAFAEASEFSGADLATPFDQQGSATTASSPLTCHASGIDTLAGGLAVVCSWATGSKSATSTIGNSWSPTGTTSVVTNLGQSGATKSTSWCNFSCLTLGNAVNSQADTDSVTWTLSTGAFTGSGIVGAIATFVPPRPTYAPPINGHLFLNQSVARGANW